MSKKLVYSLAVLCLVCLMCLSFVGGYIFAESRESDDSWAYAMDNIICVGDSLTEGARFNGDKLGIISQSYPHYLGRMLSAEVTNAGASGYSASDWYEEKIDQYDFADYDCAVIWLGTNEGYTDTLAEDVEAYGSYQDYAKTETGYYCRIIERIKEQNPDCLILLMNIYASKSDVELSNQVIDKIAQRYDLHVIDTQSLNMDNTQLHAGRTNPHMGKAGNIAAARLIVEDVSRWLAEAPVRCEFGLDFVK